MLNETTQAAPETDANDGCASGALIEIERLPIPPGAKAGRWRVWHDGAVLCGRARDPEHAACRALLALGITGTLTTRHKGSTTISMSLDIARGAEFTTSDPDKGRLKVIRWHPREVEIEGDA
jgi:hypothetical protein